MKNKGGRIAALLSRSLIIVIFLLAGWTSDAMGQRDAVLHRFIGGQDGSNPHADLISDPAGNLYGTTLYGGTGSCNVNNQYLGCGTVFELHSKSSGGWAETVLYSFRNSPSDGQYPVSGLVRDQAGKLYGTTGGGGTANCGYGGCGTVFELTPPAKNGGAWTEAILYNFQGGRDGLNPQAGLKPDGHGRLYGTTLWGGNFQGSCTNFALGCGTVFRLTPPRAGPNWTHTVLYEFQPNNDGQQPQAGLALDDKGSVYGTTVFGGYISFYCGSGCGTVFKVSPPVKRGGAWKETVLLQFAGSDGGSPLAGLIFDRRGNLYGTTSVGQTTKGEFNGTVFRLSPPAKRGSQWRERVLYRFGTSGGPAAPYGGVILDHAGNLYGTTVAGGKFALGAVFRLAPPVEKHGAWTENTLHEFSGGSDGAFPQAGLVFGRGQQLYGTAYDGGDTSCSPHGYDACGVAFKISP